MSWRSRSTWPVAAVALLCAVALGAAIAIAVVRPPIPPTLQSGAAATSVPVSRQAFDDARSVELDVTLGGAMNLTAPRGGRITSLACSVGTHVLSGGTSISIDGTPMLSLATSTPLWRDLARGAVGADVSALQTELTRLGYPVPVTGVLGSATLSSFAAAMKAIGTVAPKNSVPLSAVSWLAAPDLVIEDCPVSVGASVEPGVAVLEFETVLLSAAIAAMPDGIAPGDRVVEVSSGMAAVDADGRVVDPAALAVIAASTEFADYRRTADSGPMRVSLVLATSLDVAVVAPGAVYAIDNQLACVADGPDEYPVTIVGSELGQTFVLFEGDPPASVDLDVDGRPACK